MATEPERPLPERRRTEFLRTISESGQVTVKELAEAFNVSADTVRRDLDSLTRQGTVRRTHGGAVAPDEGKNVARTLDRRLQSAPDAKGKIGKAAAHLVRDDATVILNGGSTTLQIAIHLSDVSGLNVITNNLRLPAVLNPEVVRSVYLIGGRYWPDSEVTLGPFKLPGIERFSADIAFLGVAGISHDGISSSNTEEVQMIRDILESTARVVVVSDQTKFARNAFAHIAPLDALDVLVTDAGPEGQLAQALEAAEVKVIVA